MTNTAIGYKIREQRKRLGITQVKLAQEAGISAAYLNLIEANKRNVGGKLLGNLARVLQLDLDTLSGVAEQRLRDDLRELPLDPLFRRAGLDRDFADEIVARNPGWARMMLTAYRAYLDSQQALNLLGDRLNRDPAFQASVHSMLTHITTIRSTAEILDDVDDLSAEQLRRFHQVLHLESAELTDAAHRVVDTFELQETANSSLAAAEEVDEFIIGNRNHFPKLEDAAEGLRRQALGGNTNNVDGTLTDFLQNKLNVTIRTASPGETGDTSVREQSRFDPEARVLSILAHTPATTRRFQLVRLIADLVYPDLLRETVDDPRLDSDTSRRRAAHALSSYIAGAVMLPYERFLHDAEEYRYDIEVLRQRYESSHEQVCHRLVTLRRPGAEGVPFAYLRVDSSGHISKRFPLYGLPMPRYGHACPLWAVFLAFQTPARVIRTLTEFPDGKRFLMIARTVTKRAGAFHAQPVVFSIMLACDAIHADRTVYAEGIHFDAAGAVERVGSSCRQCNRKGCYHRQEAQVEMSSG